MLSGPHALRASNFECTRVASIKVGTRGELPAPGERSLVEVLRELVPPFDGLERGRRERAVREPAPYDPWPAEMKEIIGDNRRFVRFTFRYN